jgi:hypothetical protein
VVINFVFLFLQIMARIGPSQQRNINPQDNNTDEKVMPNPLQNISKSKVDAAINQISPRRRNAQVLPTLNPKTQDPKSGE